MNCSDLGIVIGKPAFQVLPMSSKCDASARWRSGWGSVALQRLELTIASWKDISLEMPECSQ